MDEIIKIAIIDPIGSNGGMVYYDYGLALGLKQNQVEPFIFTCIETDKRFEDQITTIHGFKRIWSLKLNIRKFFAFIGGYFRSTRIAKKKGIKIAHLHVFKFNILTVLAILIVRSKGLKLVATLHDVEPFHKRSVKVLEGLGLKLINAFIVHNESSEKIFLPRKPENAELYVIPHGNYRPFIKEEDIKQTADQEEFRLLFFGLIKEVKGLEILIKAAELVKKSGRKVHLTIAGNPWHVDSSYYTGLIEQAGLTENSTLIFRHIADSELPDLFANNDVVVLPYKRIYQSGVALLAMSYNKPILTSDLPPFKELIKDNETGFLFESENEGSLAKKIMEISDNRELLHTVVQNASRELNDKYDWVAIGKQTKEVYKRLLK